MPLSNAERQRRWRDKRTALADEAKKTRNWQLDLLVKDRIQRDVLLPKERRLAVQLLVKSADAEDDAEMLAWLRARTRGAALSASLAATARGTYPRSANARDASLGAAAAPAPGIAGGVEGASVAGLAYGRSRSAPSPNATKGER
jgi:hypothetical protein